MSAEQDRVTPDLVHLARISAILDAIPPGTNLLRAMLALQDAYACCEMAAAFGLTLERAREIHRESVSMLGKAGPK